MIVMTSYLLRAKSRVSFSDVSNLVLSFCDVWNVVWKTSALSTWLFVGQCEIQILRRKKQ